MYRSGDEEREKERREARERAHAEEARFADALRERKIWTPAVARVVKWSAAIVAGVVLVVVLSSVGKSIYRRTLPCGGEWSRCVDATHLEICDGERTVVRCARCDGLCVPPDPPMAGDACQICDREGIGTRVKPEETRCSADRRAILSCSGCFSVWKLDATCAEGKACVDDARCE